MISNSRSKLLEQIFFNLKKNKIKSLNKNFTYFNDKGYLSNSDIVIDKIIKEKIKNNFQKDIIFSEETENNFKHFDNKKYVWVIDPICGTTNFIRGIDLYAHSISVIKGSKIFGGVLNPSNKNIFYTDSKKSFLNKRAIKCSNTKKLNEAVISINCNQSSKNLSKIKKLFKIFSPPVTRRLKILESANPELSVVAAGKLDAYINPDDKIWDLLVGSELVKNAGGRFRYFKGSLNNPKLIKGVIASNKYLFNQIIKLINEKF